MKEISFFLLHGEIRYMFLHISLRGQVKLLVKLQQKRKKPHLPHIVSAAQIERNAYSTQHLKALNPK